MAATPPANLFDRLHAALKEYHANFVADLAATKA